MVITSDGFKEGGIIPSVYTCDGRNASPPLKWSSVPAGTKSFVLICDDPDAPAGTWVHWVYYDIPAGVSGLPENVEAAARPGPGGAQGINDFRRTGYGGPSPPRGTHRYFFLLYATDTVLSIAPGRMKSEVLDAIKGHVLAEAVLMGKYSRQ